MIDNNGNEQPSIPGGPGDDPQLPPTDPHGPAGDDAPIGLRVGRNPGNLGDEVADLGDVTYPSPEPNNVQEA